MNECHLYKGAAADKPADMTSGLVISAIRNTQQEELHALLHGVTGDLQVDHRGDEWRLAQVQSFGW